MEDDNIIALYLRRDETAIARSAEQYGSRLRTLSLGITADAQTAEECENDTYLQAWHLIPPNEPRGYLYAFLARITRHISIDRCRAEARQKRLGQIEALSEELQQCLPSSEDVESTLSAEELGRAISRYLRTLPQEKQVIFVRRYFYLDSVTEIANRCAVSQSKLKSSLFRTRSGLRNYLKKEGYPL